MLRRYVTFIVNWPKTVVAVVMAVTVVLAFFIGHLRLQLDMDAQIPPGHPYVIIGHRVEKLFGGKYMTVIGFYPRTGTIYTPSILGKVKRITDKLEQMPGVKPGSVVSLMSPRVKDYHSTEDALEITPLADKVPETEAEIEKFRARVLANETITGLLVAADGRATQAIVDFEDFDKAGGPKGLYDRLETIVGPERDANLEIVPAGLATTMPWLLVYTKRIGALFMLALAMIGYLHYRAFRTLQGMIVPLVTAILGVVWSLGLMGLIRAPMDPWNIMTPILLLAIGAGHSVQILKRYYEEFNRGMAQRPDLSLVAHNRNAVIEATTKVGVVMLAAGTIASLSFGSLVAFGLPSIRNFGLYTAFGILAALTVEMTFIPAVRMLMSPPSARQTEREKRQEYFDPILEKLASIIQHKRELPIIWVFSGLILAAIVGVTRLETNNNLAAQFFEANAPIRGFRLADSRLVGTRVIQVLVEGNERDAIKNPEVLKRMDALSTYITHQPLPIGRVTSIVDVFKLLSRAVNSEDKIGTLPDSREAVAQYLMLVSGDEDDLRRYVDKDYQRAVVAIYVRTDDNRAMKAMTVAVQAEANRLFADVPVKAMVGGGAANAVALNETIVNGKTVNLIQISLLVLVISSVLLRSFSGGLLVLMPLLTAALVNLGLMGWMGIPLSMGTAAISAMAVGIGADYAVYFLFRVREEFLRLGDLREATATALTTSGKAIAYVASAVAGGYLCLTLSFFKMHVLLGVLVALTMVTSSAATVAFLPSVVVRLTPRFLRRSASAGQNPAPQAS
jgi:uncharacterized protein